MKKLTNSLIILCLFFAIIISLSAVSASDNISYMQDSNNSQIVSDSNNISNINTLSDSNTSLVNDNQSDYVNDTIISNTTENNTINTTEDNTTNITNSTNITLKNTTNLTVNDLVKYYNVSGNFTGKLNDLNGNPIIGQHIALNLTKTSNNVSKIYWVTTDTNGEFQLEINLASGVYTAFATYTGTDIYNSSVSKIASIIVTTTATGLNKSVLTANNFSEILNAGENFTGKLMDADGNIIIGQHIALNLTRLSNGASKIYWVTTDTDGEYQLPINLAVGEYSVTATYAGNSVYAPDTASATIIVFKHYNGTGIFVNYAKMKSLNFTTLVNDNISTIFLSYGSILLSNRTYVESWIKTANSYGLSVSIWYQVFYNNSKWYTPITSTGEINQTLLNQKISEVTYYANITGINGIFLDYIRYGGNAYEFANSTVNPSETISYYVQELSQAIKTVNSNLIVSGAILADTQGEYYYGQNVSSLSKYLDIIVPMIYSQNTAYLVKMTKYYISLSNNKTVWPALRTYVSETNITLISYDTLLNETSEVLNAGANGVAYFRFGLMKFS